MTADQIIPTITQPITGWPGKKSAEIAGTISHYVITPISTFSRALLCGPALLSQKLAQGRHILPRWKKKCGLHVIHHSQRVFLTLSSRPDCLLL